MAYRFEWDASKASSNLTKHGVPFDEAASAFGDPLALLMADPDHSVVEERHVLLGESARGRLLVVAFAERPPATRIISARLATRRERRDYEEGT
ncbi:MAG: BrnT family toxin [Armatimonadetes bacterium]|nr:BrnT family toxin [Armatimonadota bacterium]